MNFTVFYRVFIATNRRNHHSASRNVTSLQNAKGMTSLSSLSDVKLCPFDPDFRTNSQYICYKYEKCCREGCCSTYGISNYPSWCFWLIIGVILLIFYLGSWYCKKMELKRKRRLTVSHSLNRSAPSSANSSPRVSPRRRGTEDNVDQLLDHIIHSYRLQSLNETSATPTRRGANIEPPPKYQEALNMPKVVRVDVQVVQVHANDVSTIENADNCNEVLPTYEDAVQNSRTASK